LTTKSRKPSDIVEATEEYVALGGGDDPRFKDVIGTHVRSGKDLPHWVTAPIRDRYRGAEKASSKSALVLLKGNPVEDKKAVENAAKKAINHLRIS
jgi:hypothetical protein